MDKDEKRMRREIANSNERRRMQSINAGFQSLRQMLPHHEGEKLSKHATVERSPPRSRLTDHMDSVLADSTGPLNHAPEGWGAGGGV
ncbi:hypothetical protein ZHAS_00013509 [Anopheles sinensis]|uniref:BHLH domain-containing protein n=1 Tax=Anopheles sinensis TaxID=74873 RepID=A0A084W608_ANOSI|nr:hypothetical protein ZHAS_00013509 [Anopheles sinensis]